MEGSVQPGDEPEIPEVHPPTVLRDAIAAVAFDWLVGCVETGVARSGTSASDPLLNDARAMADVESQRLVDRVAELLATDVDQQRANPLAVFRGAVVHPARVLQRHSVPTPDRDDWDARAFPDDLYDLGPATWADIDESLVEPGLVWGAWKAATVLWRRRDEG